MPTQKFPFTSVIVPAKNAAPVITACLQALKQQSGLTFGQDYEVILVDDGSTDDTARLSQQCGVTVVSQPNAGPAAARNSGVRHAKGEIVAFTDADCIPAPEWLCSILQPFNDPQVMGAKGVYRTREKGLVPRFVQIEYESKYERMKHLDCIDFVDTYSAAYRRAIFLENNGFDEIFRVPSVEDQEFSFRLARKGYRLVFSPQAVVYHRHDLNLGEYIHRKFGIGYWKMVMLNWLPEKTFSDSHTPASQRLQILLLGALFAALFFGLFWPPMLWAVLAVLLVFVLTALPFMAFIARRDPPVLSVTIPLLLVRAFVLVAGLVAGALHAPPGIRLNRKGLNMTERLIKRIIDVVGAALGLTLSLPVLLIAAIAIKLDSPGPVIFGQVRSGENGKPFRIFKLRTMIDGAEQKLAEVLKDNPLDGPVFKIPNDSRITRVGHVLRRWSVDEIPQFWNVLKGDMSLVGPRPEELWVVEKYNDAQRQRLLVRPGITGPMQVSGRGRLGMDARLALEMEYVEQYSLWKDFQIMFQSIAAIIKGDGAF